jgi:hypothetical protein
MKTYIRYTLVLLALGLFLQSCNSKSQRQIERQLDITPAFVSNPPSDTEEFLFATGTAVSSRRSLAHRQAAISANTNMAFKLSSKIEALQKLFEEEVSVAERSNYQSMFSLATQQITAQTLTGVAEQEVVYQATENGRIEAFILVRMPLGQARTALENALSRDQELYVRFRESQAFEQLQNQLERLGLE